MTDPYRTAAAIEPDEPPGAFAARVVSLIVPRVNLLGLIDAVSARDAAVRREARELLFTWERLAREGAFGEDFAACAPDCDCVVCATHAALATGGSNV